MTQPEQRHAALEEFLTVARRYRAVIIISTLLVPIAAFVLSTQQSKVFRATSEVLLEQQDLGGALTGIPTASTSTDPERYARTQAALASVGVVAQRALVLAGVKGMTAVDLLDNSTVSPRVDADLLRFTVDDADGGQATKLATAYAKAFTSYKLENDTGSLERARVELEKGLATLRAQDATGSVAYSDLVKKVQDLRTLELLQTRASVVRPASEAVQVKPRPLRTAALGVALGLLLGLGIAFLSNALDKRIRSEDEVEEGLGVPLLARLPKYSAKGASREPLVMLHAPSHLAAESVRRLRTNLELSAATGDAKVIMVTSAAAKEGKSTTVSNLAVALARSGHRVALVDLDLRQPMLARLFNLEKRPGVTEVVVGRSDLSAALMRIDLPSIRLSTSDGVSATGSLEVLPAGSIPPDPGEFVASPRLALVLRQLRESHDFVLIDGPPMLAVGDSVSLSILADAMFVVMRLSVTNRPMLKDLARVLGACPARKLGFVLTDVDVKEIYGAGNYDYLTKDDPRDLQPVPLREVTAPRI